MIVCVIVIVIVIVYTHKHMGMLCIRASARVAWQVSPEARARRRELLLQSVTLLDEDVHASLLAQVHDCIAVCMCMCMCMCTCTCICVYLCEFLSSCKSPPCTHIDTDVVCEGHIRIDTSGRS
jgi:hypothetical protein